MTKIRKILIAVVILAVLGGWFFITAVPEESNPNPFSQGLRDENKLKESNVVETKTYVNEEYGFQFNYPVTHEVYTMQTHGAELGIQVIPIDGPDYPRKIVMYLPPRSAPGYHPSSDDLEDYKDDYTTRAGDGWSSEVVIFSTKLFRINNLQALKQRYRVELRHYYPNGSYNYEMYPGTNTEQYRYILKTKDSGIFIISSYGSSYISEMFLNNIASSFSVIQ